MESLTSNLSVLDIPVEESYSITTPTMVEIVPGNWDFLENQVENDLGLPAEDACFCEWQSWDERGLMCVGVVCSESCPQTYRECREVRRACIVRR